MSSCRWYHYLIGAGAGAAVALCYKRYKDRQAVEKAVEEARKVEYRPSPEVVEATNEVAGNVETVASAAKQVAQSILPGVFSSGNGMGV